MQFPYIFRIGNIMFSLNLIIADYELRKDQIGNIKKITYIFENVYNEHTIKQNYYTLYRVPIRP